MDRGTPFVHDGENHRVAETCSQSFGPENAKFTVHIQLGLVVSHVNRSNSWVRSNMALKERQVIGRMYVINSGLEIGEKDTYLQIIIKDS